MVKEFFSAVTKKLPVIAEKLPTILTWANIIFEGVAIVTAATETPKFVEEVNQKKDEMDIPEQASLPFKETFKIGAKHYWKTGLIYIASAGCSWGSNKINQTRQLALVAAYALSEKNAKNLKEGLEKTLGKRKTQEVKDTIAKDQLAENPPKDIIATGAGDVLFYDSISGRYFHSTMEKVRGAVNAINHLLLTCDQASLNDFYDSIGLPNISLGDQLGWNLKTNDFIEAEFSSQLIQEGPYAGTPCAVVGFAEMPWPKFSLYD